jgi:hypothetical protein
MRRNLPVVFSSGAFGGLVNALAFYVFSLLGIVAMFGMPPVQGWRPEFIYRQTVWGGLWGIVFLIPFLGKLTILEGAVLSLLPTIAAWFIFIPARMPVNARPGLKGLFLVIILNAFWGIATVLMIKYFENKKVKEQ